MDDFLALFTRAARLLRGAADGAMSGHGVRIGQNLVLDVLWRGDGLTPGELAERLGVATPTVVRSAARMTAAGLLTKRPDPHDARLVRLYLTERAHAVRQPVEGALRQLTERATATLTGEERRHLASALAKIVAQLEGLPPGAAETPAGQR